MRASRIGRRIATTTIYVARHHTVWVSDRMPIRQQRHYHVKLVVALDGRLWIDAQQRTVRGLAGIVAPDVAHQTRTEGKVLGLLLDPRTDDARRLRRDVLDSKPIAALSESWVVAHRPQLQAFAARPPVASSAAALVKTIVASLTRVQLPLKARDARITAALEHVAAHADESIRLCDLARVACLSPGRFSHLFRAEMGVSVRRFVLWSRMRHANKLVFGGASLTAAAHAAGFTDSAHFSRTYQQLFAVSPSTLLSNDEVQIVTGPE